MVLNRITKVSSPNIKVVIQFKRKLICFLDKRPATTSIICIVFVFLPFSTDITGSIPHILFCANQQFYDIRKKILFFNNMKPWSLNVLFCLSHHTGSDDGNTNSTHGIQEKVIERGSTSHVFEKNGKVYKIQNLLRNKELSQSRLFTDFTIR